MIGSETHMEQNHVGEIFRANDILDTLVLYSLLSFGADGEVQAGVDQAVGGRADGQTREENTTRNMKIYDKFFVTMSQFVNKLFCFMTTFRRRMTF